jgi:short-subunit dehydrogenase
MFNSKIKHPTEPKKVIIVGATSGIGKSLTELYIQKN